MKSNDETFGPVIFAYTRANAIADGVLFDVTLVSRHLAGTNAPVAITCAARAELNEAAAKSGPMNDASERSAAALCFALVKMGEAIRKPDAANSCEAHFSVKLPGADPVNLYAVSGPGDTPAPVITIMREGED